MIAAPNRMTKRATVEFEAKVREVAQHIMMKHEVDGILRVVAVKTGGRNRASIQILNPTRTAKEHYAIAQDFKREGFATAMIFGILREDRTEMFPLLYPMSPTDSTISDSK